jgi:uncharacterized alpha-E superfamily protein
MYWMSRYLERAEHTARVMDVNFNRMLEQKSDDVLARRALLLNSLNLDDVPPDSFGDDDDFLWALTFDLERVPSILRHVMLARENARQIREQISSEMWNNINELYLNITTERMKRLWRIQPNSFMLAIKNGAHLFQGVTDSTMNHNEGWHFIQVGRSLERALAVASLLDSHMARMKDEWSEGHDLTPEAYFEWLALLKSVTAFEAYTKVYQTEVRPDYVIEFLLFNPEFPHSARFCVEQMVQSLNAIGEATKLHKNSKLHRLTGRLQSALSYDEIGEIMASDLHTYLNDINHQAVQIHQTIYETFIAYSIEATLR